MHIQFYNTLSAKKEEFKSISKNHVKMYCCGVTPYSNTHIGHSRTFFSYDLLYKTLKDHNYNVIWARNITDIDDKIIHKANVEGISCSDLIHRFVTEQNEMLEIFELNRPSFEPKVTDNIQAIIEMIEKLIHKEFAYVSKSGVYYRIRKFTEYGKLSKNKIDELKKGARIEIDEFKEDALDFALWKFAKPEEIFWPSPWGNGRPGWHIECSAMIHTLFGDSIDIHMGGRDLIFPHHEAEIAQSEGVTGKTLASTWLHAGMVTLYGEKMSKSTNHYISIKDFLTKYPAEVLRLIFLSVSYDQPLDFTFELATENLKKLAKIYHFTALIDSYSKQQSSNAEKKLYEPNIFTELENLIYKMRSHLADNLNSGAALAVFFEFIRSVNTHLNKMEKTGMKLNETDLRILENYWLSFKKWVKESLGILTQEPNKFFADLHMFNLGTELSTEVIETKLQERKNARNNKNWSLSDSIRDELLQQGVQIQDTPTETKWTVII